MEPRPDLTLEERRARLGIKARKFLPLNPAVMEKYILDNFGLKVYLDEDDVGHIHLIANQLTEVGWNKMISWLLAEKPAHLLLDATLFDYSYTGTNPNETTSTDEVIVPGKLPLPKTPADKKNYRRIFAGGVLAVSGSDDVGLRRVHSSKQTLYAGTAIAHGGEDTVNLYRAKSSKVVLRVGCPFVVFEDVLIDSKDMPLFRVKENPTADLAIANVAIARGDNFVEPPAYDFLKIFFRFPATNNRRYITLKNPRDNLTRDEVKAVSDYAVKHELLLNTVGNVTNQAPRADLIAKKITTLI